MDGNSDSSSDEEYYRELEKIKELQKQKESILINTTLTENCLVV